MKLNRSSMINLKYLALVALATSSLTMGMELKDGKLPPLYISCQTKISAGTIMSIVATGFLARAIKVEATEMVVLNGATGAILLLAGIDLICAGFETVSPSNQPDPNQKLASK